MSDQPMTTVERYLDIVAFAEKIYDIQLTDIQVKAILDCGSIKNIGLDWARRSGKTVTIAVATSYWGTHG